MPNSMTLLRVFDGDLTQANGGVECEGYKNNSDFRPISRFISEIIQDRAIVLQKANRKPYASFRMVPVSMTLSDL